MNPGTVSVVIPIHNAQATLGRALESVYRQTQLPDEVICVDDGSTDGSESIGASFGRAGTPRLLWLRMPSNRGPAAARNFGVAEASSRYIAFLDADDAWHPCKLESQMKVVLEHDLDLIGGHLLVSPSADWEPRGKPAPIRWDAMRLWPAMFSNPYHTSAVLMRRDIHYRFPESGQLCEDYFLWLQCLADGWKCARHSPELCAMFKPSYGQGGLSRNLLKMQRGELSALCNVAARGHMLAAALAIPWSCAKFVVRLLMTHTRKWRTPQPRRSDT